MLLENLHAWQLTRITIMCGILQLELHKKLVGKRPNYVETIKLETYAGDGRTNHGNAPT